ncbi:MAG: cytochrome c [Planctomycetaceae bacterium]
MTTTTLPVKTSLPGGGGRPAPASATLILKALGTLPEGSLMWLQHRVCDSAQAVESGQRRLGRRLAVVVALGVLAGLAADGVAAPGQRGKAKTIRRAAPPAGRWDALTRGMFVDDAFALLAGPRPDYGSARQPAAAAPAEAAPETGAVRGRPWSTLVSADTLADEAKDMKDLVASACSTLSDFKGGGFEDARCGYSSLAMLFGVIAAYDQADVRWRKDAATARDLFARVGFNCKVGTEQSFAEAQARLEDLTGLLDGNSPQPSPSIETAERWSQMTGRSPLMTRLEMAQEVMRPAIASRAAFEKRTAGLLHAAEIMAVIGEVIQQPDFEDHDDETYKGYAATMRDAALQVRDACLEGDYEAARAAAGKLEQSCDACHGDYRS